MTRERAIQIMSNYDLNFHEVNEKLFDYGEVAEAFDLAIKALEAPPNDNWEGYSKRLWENAYERGKADAEQRWIPVTERLPEEDKQVLVTECFTGINGKKIYSISLASLYGNDWVTVNDEYKLDPSRFKVVAWMPSPEPYKAESEVV